MLGPGAWGLVLLSYFAGAVPTGYWAVKRLRGLDIREHGSGNPGTANVYRVAGAGPGAITLLGDASKGYLPVYLAQQLYPRQLAVAVLCGAAAIIGHDWTIFLGFKGGKGVATSAGVFAALLPKAAAASAMAFILGTAFSGHISVGSLAAALVLPLGAGLCGAPAALTSMSACAAALILFKHIPNMKRLWKGSELGVHGR
ncbi:MAG: glycerol-3-phosphate 1-O-acyltransferase PlsY [Elusimicrobia bacterium]|nr:glycerol-3-phosphate 1-O-acyltransferase PlsY [Elusimicrobiota bacterium]